MEFEKGKVKEDAVQFRDEWYQQLGSKAKRQTSSTVRSERPKKARHGGPGFCHLQ